MANSKEEISAWFESLEEAFQGPVPGDHPLIKAHGGMGWRVRTMGTDVLLLADCNFPYSRPQAFIEKYDLSRPRPHIEPMPELAPMARVCLLTPTIPGDPLLAMQAAVRDVRELLKANDRGEEDHDFETDFEAYWRHYLPTGCRNAKLHGPWGAHPETGVFFYRNGTYFCFPNKIAIRRWEEQLNGVYVRDPLRFPVVELTRFPRPDRFASDITTLMVMLKRYTANGIATVGGMLRACPRRLPVVFAGIKPDGNPVKVAVELVLRSDDRGSPLMKARVQSKLPDEDIIRLYDVAPLNTANLDAALNRLPNPAIASMQKKVAIIGCGALGSGIAMMLAKAGVTRFILIDPDLLGWENIRRHELGAEWVGASKTAALKARIQRSLPAVEQVVAYSCGVQALLASNPKLLDDVDLIVAATGDWGSDVFINDKVAELGRALPVLYTWMEAYALAGHSVVIYGEKGKFTDGFDCTGNFKGKASHAGLKMPPECGNMTSPFGAIELAQSQAVAGRLALEVLTGRYDGDVWRTWTADDSVVQYAEGSWSQYWLETRGRPPSLGGVSQGAWEF